MPFKKSLLALTVGAASVGLTACGGGGSSSSDPAPVDQGTPDPWLISDWFAASGDPDATDNNRSDVMPSLTTAGTASQPLGFPTDATQVAGHAFAAPTAKFVSTDYIGAFDPNAATPWTAGWTVNVHGNTHVWEPTVASPVADGTCPVGTTDAGDLVLHTGGSMDTCALPARIDTDVTLTSDNVYVFADANGAFVGWGEDTDTANDTANTLTIEPGTLILGEGKQSLKVTRGAQINAAGTAADPIVMTSLSDYNHRVDSANPAPARGDWAGFALMGNAPTNECGTPCNVEAEGGIGVYGGTNDADSSGTIQYVVVKYAGNEISPDNELNGFTLFGVGSGTTIDHIQVDHGKDDGVEHFGSSDFMSHIVLTNNADDSFDWGQGYTGGAQFVLVKQADDDADRAIEADNDKANNDATPISGPTLANMTLIGPTNAGVDAEGSDGLLLRRGTGARIWNSIVTGFADVCIDIDDAGTFDRAHDGNDWTGDLMMENSIVYCSTNFKDGEVQ